MKMEAYTALLTAFIVWVLAVGIACVTAELIAEYRKRNRRKTR